MSAPPVRSSETGLDELVGHLLRKSHLIAQRCFAEAFEGTEISPVQFALLVCIEHEPHIGHKALAALVATAPSVVTTALKPLIELKLVEQRGDAGDARLSVYRLSPRGASFLDRLRPRIAHSSHLLEAPLTNAETNDLRRLLAKLVAGRRP